MAGCSIANDPAPTTGGISLGTVGAWHDRSDADAQVLARDVTRGDLLRPCDAAGVDSPIRRGSTVHRPARGNTEFTQRLLSHLEDSGAGWSPRALGFDEEGREVVTWIPGEVATSGEEVDMTELARIVRDLHDLTNGLVAGFECVIHDDLQPRNTIVRERRPVGLIDWEQARPGRRVEDVANLCWSFAEPTPDGDREHVAQQWRSVVDAYGLDEREAVVSTVLSRMAVCAEDIEREPARGSARHRALAERGDHLAIGSMRAWVVTNAKFLQSALIA